MERREVKKPRIWEQQIPVETKILERTYRCPVCNSFLFGVPYNWPIPKEKMEMVCPNGHRVNVPKFQEIQVSQRQNERSKIGD